MNPPTTIQKKMMCACIIANVVFFWLRLAEVVTVYDNSSASQSHVIISGRSALLQIEHLTLAPGSANFGCPFVKASQSDFIHLTAFAVGLDLKSADGKPIEIPDWADSGLLPEIVFSGLPYFLTMSQVLTPAFWMDSVLYSLANAALALEAAGSRARCPSSPKSKKGGQVKPAKSVSKLRDDSITGWCTEDRLLSRSLKQAWNRLVGRAVDAFELSAFHCNVNDPEEYKECLYHSSTMSFEDNTIGCLWQGVAGLSESVANYVPEDDSQPQECVFPKSYSETKLPPALGGLRREKSNRQGDQSRFMSQQAFDARFISGIRAAVRLLLSPVVVEALSKADHKCASWWKEQYCPDCRLGALGNKKQKTRAKGRAAGAGQKKEKTKEEEQPVGQMRGASGIPLLGFGTGCPQMSERRYEEEAYWGVKGKRAIDAAVVKVIQAAIKEGYRLIDTAEVYDNEELVGEAIKRSGLPRKDFFIITKLDDEKVPQNPAAARAHTRKTVEKQLERLQTSYIDGYMIHHRSPVLNKKEKREKRFVPVVRELEALQKEGVIRKLGNCAHNGRPACTAEFSQDTFDLFSVSTHVVRKEAKQLVAFGQFRALPEKLASTESSHLRAIANHLGKTPSQVMLRWLLQRGISSLRCSGNPKHMKQNAPSSLNFQLSIKQMALLNQHLSWVNFPYIDPDQLKADEFGDLKGNSEFGVLLDKMLEDGNK